MNIKEVARSIFYNIFIIFSCIIFCMVVFLRFLGYDAVMMVDIAAAFVIAFFTSFAEVIVRSRKVLKKSEILIRNIIHLFVVISIGMSVASYMRWFVWSNLSGVFIFIGMTIAVYIMVFLIEFYQTKKLTDKMNKKLEERYNVKH